MSLKITIIIAGILLFVLVYHGLSTRSLRAGIDAETKGEWGKAIEIYSESLSKDPSRSDLWLRLSDIHARQKNIAGVIAALEQTSILLPIEPEVFAKLSQAYAMDKQPTKAFEAVRRALELDPENTSYRYRCGFLAEESGAWSEAVEIYRDIIASDASQGHLWRRIADIEAHNQRLPRMIEALTRLSEYESRDATIYYKLSQAYAMNQQPQEAVEAARQAVALDPDNITYQHHYGLLAEENGAWGKAVEIYRNIIASDASQGHLWRRIADIEAHNQRLPRMIEALMRLSEYESQDATIYYKLSQAYAMNKQPQKAFEVARQAVALDPDNITYQRHYGLLAEENEAWEQALEIYNKILSREQRN